MGSGHHRESLMRKLGGARMHDYKNLGLGDMTEPVNFFKGVCMGLLFSAGMVALVWLMLL